MVRYNRYNITVSKLMSNIFFRALLGMALMMLGALFIRFSVILSSVANSVNEQKTDNKIIMVDNIVNRMLKNADNRFN